MYNEFKTVHIIHVQCECSNVLTYAKFCCGYCTLEINALKYLNGVISVKKSSKHPLHLQRRKCFKETSQNKIMFCNGPCYFKQTMKHLVSSKESKKSIFWPDDYKYFSILILINSISRIQEYLSKIVLFKIQKCKAIECIRIMIQ